MKKKLIIVYGKDEKKYATYLQQLLSERDDTEARQIGTKDGTVEAIAWDEKQFEDNRVKLSSSNFVLFLGNTNSFKAARENMTNKFDEVGMKFGWLGSQAYMYVEGGSLNRDNFDAFKGLCEKYQKSFEKELELRYSPSELEGEQVDIKDVALAAAPIAAVGLLGPIGAIAAGAAGVAAGVAAEVGVVAAKSANAVAKQGRAMADKVNDMFIASDAKDQQYSLLTLIMYMDGMALFLGE